MSKKSEPSVAAQSVRLFFRRYNKEKPVTSVQLAGRLNHGVHPVSAACSALYKQGVLCRRRSGRGRAFEYLPMETVFGADSALNSEDFEVFVDLPKSADPSKPAESNGVPRVRVIQRKTFELCNARGVSFGVFELDSQWEVFEKYVNEDGQFVILYNGDSISFETLFGSIIPQDPNGFLIEDRILVCCSPALLDYIDQ